MATQAPEKKNRRRYAQPLTLKDRDKGNKRISMWMNEELHEKLNKDAEITGVPYSEVMRQLAVKFMEQPVSKRRAAIRNIHKGRDIFDENTKVHFELTPAAA